MNNYFDVCALHKQWDDMTIHASFSMQQGTMTVLLGQSGCGKTTILKMLCGITKPDSGKILLDGIDITNLSPQKRNIGMVFQSQVLFPHLNVIDNVAYGLAIRGLSRKDRYQEAMQFLEMVGLTNFEKRSVQTLSGGECQRVALARTLAVQPKVILFDEPLSSLDPELRATLRAQIREYQQQLNLTALFVTHDVAEALSIADAISIMENGHLIASGSSQDLYFKPPNEAVARFLGSGNCITVKGKRFFVPFSGCCFVPGDVIPAESSTKLFLKAITGSTAFLGLYTSVCCKISDKTQVTLYITLGQSVPTPGTYGHIVIDRSAIRFFSESV